MNFSGNLPEFPYEIRLMSGFVFADSILRVETLRVVQGKVSPGLNCLENESMGRRDFFVEVWVHISWHIF